MIESAVERVIDGLEGRKPKTAAILGSGLGDLTDAIVDAIHIPYAELESFPRSGVTGHAGKLVCGSLSGTEIIALSGRSHYYEQGDAGVMRPALEMLKAVGIERVIVTNAAGSVREDIPPGSVMMVEDHINYSGMNPLIGEDSDERFVSMSNAYDRLVIEALTNAANAENIPVHRGVYMWFSGPSFETPAEIRMARTLGADAVGMSTVPEVILGRFLGLRVAACSVITNLGAGMTAGDLSHQETKDMAPIGGAKLKRILSRMLADESGSL
ncbi:MAG: purine-nucleoside phosphorylase [Pseudomonadota bacterium]